MAGKLLLFLALGTAFSASVEADHSFGKLRGSHFLRPSRALFYFRPTFYSHGYSVPYVRRYYLHYSYGYDVITPYIPYSSHGRGAYGVYRLILNSPRGEIVRANTADLIFNVQPSKALVYVDDKLIGSAQDFSSERDRYTLISGVHDLRIEFPGYEAFRTQLDVTPDRTLHLDIELKTEPRR